MTDSILEDNYEMMPDDVLKIKDKILDELGGERTHIIIMALMSALIEVIIRTAPSKESAIETSAGIALSMGASIRACDEAGMANWSEPLQ
jgi:hypothetical protein